MELKPHEIALIVIAIVGPTIFLVLAFVPGGLNFIGDIAMDPVRGPIVFFGAAAVLFVVLAWRIYRRIRPAERKPIATTEHVSPTRMPKVEGSKVVEQLKNRNARR
jgi:membrane protein implicated in regulation of membrane protease activity